MKNLKILLIDDPTLMAEWDYTSNNELGLSPNNLSTGSQRTAFWICKKHGAQYKQVIRNKFRGQRGCKQCYEEYLKNIDYNRYLKGKKSLAESHPNLLEEWDYNKNDILPTQVTAGSGKIVWWKCKYGHEWQARIGHRTEGSNCIYCTGQKPIVGVNDLKTTNPELIDEWDCEKNTGLVPEQFKQYSNIKVWWKCPLGHSWKTTISHRSDGTGCPHCYSENGTSFPEQAIVFYLSKYTNVENRKIIDGKEIDVYLPKYNIGFEYDGRLYHNLDNRQKELDKDKFFLEKGITIYHIKESDKFYFDIDNKTIHCIIDGQYKYMKYVLEQIQKILNINISNMDIKNDASKIYSKYIKSIKDNSVASKYPDIAKEWNYEKNNGLSPYNFTFRSNKKVWWKCNKCNSDYMATISHRTGGTSCPYCAGKKVNDTNSLNSRYPELVKQWDYKNNRITPDQIYYNTYKKVWWICQNCGKSYELAISSKIKSKTGFCSECRHSHVGNKNGKISVLKKGSLFDYNPTFLEEWNYVKNIDISPKEVTCQSGKSVWWRCKNGHEWKTTIHNRFYGTGCPICYKNKRKK